MTLFRFPAVLIALLLIVFAGCLPPAKIPIDTIHYDAGESGVARVLIVFLPGSGDSMSVFQREGLVAAVRQRGVPADMIAVNAHVGYYANGTVFKRLKEDVIGPAKKRGYRQIWLVGDSLGGYGAILYDSEYPEDISGVLLLGPFLGKKELIDDIKQAGGARNWAPKAVREKSEAAWEERLWLWFRDSESRRGFSQIYLGYGRGDRFTYAQDYLASLMPPQQVIVVDGGHNWETWKKLWDLFLNRNIFGL
ncbi:MAG TPA: alpha/beta hydrolase [Nitrospirota bacterium]